MIVGVQESLVATHLIPKRMGSDGAKAVVERFSGLQSAGGIHRYDARIGSFSHMPWIYAQIIMNLVFITLR